MTPAITLAKNSGIVHRVHDYIHDVASESYGLETAEKPGVSPDAGGWRSNCPRMTWASWSMPASHPYAGCRLDRLAFLQQFGK